MKKLHTKYKNGLDQLFQLYQAPDQELKTFIGCILLVRNSTTLLQGIYGTGKTQLVHLVKRIFFSKPGSEEPDFGAITCTQDLTPLDTLFYMDLASLIQGEEKVEPRGIVTARFKFINEIQRAGSMVYNALLPLFAEKQVMFRDRVFYSPDFVCLMDANPNDSGSSEVPQAFMDRIDFVFEIPLITSKGLIQLQDTITRDKKLDRGMLANSTVALLNTDEMAQIWQEVDRVRISDEMKAVIALVAAHLQNCVNVSRSTAGNHYKLSCNFCEFKAEACSKMEEVPGTRFILSMLKLAQARAWLRDSTEINIEDLLYGLPYTLAHRLKVQSDSRRTYPNMLDWVREEVYRLGIRPKIENWRQALYYLGQNTDHDPELLAEFCERDRAIADFINQMTGQRFHEVA